MKAELEGEYVEYVTARMSALRRFAFLLCGDEHRADDLVQQTITRLYERRRRARAATSLDQYVRTVLVSAFLDERRRGWSRRVALTGQPPEPATVAGPDVEQRTVLRQALAQVPRRQQAVLVLRFLCDLPVDEVARLLGCSAGNIKSRAGRAAAAADPGPAEAGRGVFRVGGTTWQSSATTAGWSPVRCTATTTTHHWVTVGSRCRRRRWGSGTATDRRATSRLPAGRVSLAPGRRCAT